MEGLTRFVNDTCKGAGLGVAAGATIGGVATAPVGGEGAIPGAIAGFGLGLAGGALYGIWDAIAGPREH